MLRVLKIAQVTIDDGELGVRIREREFTGTIIGPSTKPGKTKYVVEWDDHDYDYPYLTYEFLEDLQITSGT